MDKKRSRIDKNQALNRRTFLKGLGLTPLIPLLPACQWVTKDLVSSESNDFSTISPINRTINDHSLFSGDDFSRPHQILWNKNTYIESIGGWPKPTRKEDLVIIGGGMSGLMSAYLLRDKKPVILEQASRFGGNAKGEAWNGLQYSIGAAYLIKPDQDSGLYKLLKDLGISHDWTIKSGGQGNVVINGKLIENFWSGYSEPNHKATYKRLYEYFMSFITEGGNTFPDYPTQDATLRRYINTLDQEDFYSHLERIAGTALPSHLTTLLEHYCYSSFAGSSQEISAAAGINFFAAEFSDVAVFPGGNAYIAETLLKHLYRALPNDHLLPGSLVFDVKKEQSGIVVSYLDANNHVQSLLADKVIMSCPKFIASKLINPMPAAQLAAIAELEYRAYLVANLLINRPIKEFDYDLFWLGSGKADINQVAAYAKKRGMTDIINANYSSPDREKSVLSFYQAFPYQGGRAELVSQEAYANMKTRVTAQLKNEVYPYYQLTEQEIQSLRLTRWGHPLPLAAVGLLDRGIIDTLRAPIDDSIYFIEQDNWALPAIETVAAEAIYWSSLIR